MLNAIYYVPDTELDLYDDMELFNDLDQDGFLVASWSDATPSDADFVTLSVIHNDIQLLHFSVLFIFSLCFVLYLNRRSR